MNTRRDQSAGVRRYYETPPKLTVSVTATCNLDCRHCYADCTRKPLPDEMTTAEWLGFFKYLVRNGFIQVYIEGGEPAYKEGFAKLLEYSCARMMTLVRTNGTLITREVARDWKRLGVGRVFVDIMGASAATHDSLTGVPGSFELACAGVRHLVAQGIPTDIVTILTKPNAGELDRWVRLAHRLRASRVGVLRLYPLGRARANWPLLSMPIKEQYAVLSRLGVPPTMDLMQSWHPNNSNCCWQAAAVSPQGKSIGCMYLREYVDYGNVRDTPFLDTWRKNETYRMLRTVRVEGACASCEAADGTSGGCRASAYAYTGRWDAPDPYCVTDGDTVDVRVLPARPPGPAARGAPKTPVRS